MKSAQAKFSESSVWEDLKDASSLGPNLLTVDSKSFAVICLSSAIISLASFQVITNAICATAFANGYTGSAQDLIFLDLRNGYSPEEARQLMEAWGDSGRRLYLLAELIDVTLYHTGYRGASVVLFNRMNALLRTVGIDTGKGRWIAGLPVILAGIDFCEDAGQVRFLLCKPDHTDVCIWKLRPSCTLSKIQQDGLVKSHRMC